MRGWLRVVRGETRRDLLLVPAWAMLSGVLLWTHATDWGTRWNELGYLLRQDVIVLGPGCVLVAVWVGGRTRRAVAGELFASVRRSALARASAEVVALSVVAYVGILVGVVSAAWTIVLADGYGTSAAVWYVVAVLPAVLAYTALGYAVGRVVPWRITAPLAGVAMYLLLGFVVYYNDTSPGLAAGSGWLGGTEEYAFTGAAFVLSSAVLLTAALALTGAGSAERRPAATWAWLPLLVAGLLAAVPSFAATAAAAGPSQERRPALACSTDDGPRVCVLRSQRSLLALATRQARVRIARFHGIAGAPTHAGVDVPGRVDRTMLPMQEQSITPWGGPDRRYGPPALVDLLHYVDPERYCHGSLDGPSNDRSGADAVASWLDGTPAYVDDTVPANRSFRAATDAQRRAFAGRLIAATQACDATAIRAAASVLPRS